MEATTQQIICTLANEAVPASDLGANSYAEGVEQTITTIQGSSTLQTVNKGWYGPGLLACEVDTAGAAGSTSSAKYYKYGAGNQISDIKEYDYGQGNPSYCQSALALQPNNDVAPPPAGVATLSRETTVTYQSFGLTTSTIPSLFDRPSKVVTLRVHCARQRRNSRAYRQQGTTVPCRGYPRTSLSRSPHSGQ